MPFVSGFVVPKMNSTSHVGNIRLLRPVVVAVEYQEDSQAENDQAKNEEEPEEIQRIVTEIAAIIFLVSLTDFFPFISKITDPLYLPLKRGGPVCPYLENPRNLYKSLSVSLFSKKSNCLSLFRGDGRGVS